MEEKKPANEKNRTGPLSPQDETRTVVPGDMTQTENAEGMPTGTPPGIVENRETRSVSASTSLAAGEMFAHYRILKILGKGGMGVVYQAMDTRLERLVALKLVLPTSDASGKVVKRFLQEAVATARLDHPNIIKVFEVGEFPQCYFTMEYVEGNTLEALVRAGEIKHRDAAALLHKVALALQAAHDKGIIHRDVKPSNIMVDAARRPRVMDFGLAKVSDAQSSLSKTGDLLGTPAYMSPEQADGREIDPRSDVYSLGATLYSALTGRPPFQGDSYFNILHQVHCVDPLPPRKLNPDISEELEAICVKSLEKNPGNRYPDAGAMAADLENYLAGKPILARAPNALTHLKKFILRNRAASLAVLVVLVTLVAGGTFSFIQWQIAEKARLTVENAWQIADEQRRIAEAEREKVKQQKEIADRAREEKEADAVSVRMRLADIAYEKATESYDKGQWPRCGVLAGATLKFVQALPGDRALKLRNAARGLVRLAIIRRGLVWENIYPSEVKKAMWLPDGKIACLSDDAVALLDARSGRITENLARKGEIILSFSPDGLKGASVGTGNTVKLWSFDRKVKEKALTGHLAAVNLVEFSADGKTAASASADGTILLWDVAGGKRRRQIVVYPERLKLVEDVGEKIASAKGEKACHSRIQALVFSPDSKIVACAGSDEKIRLWRTSDSELLKEISCSRGPACLSLSPDGRILACGFTSGKIELWEVASGEPLGETVTGGGVYTIAFGLDGRTIATGGSENGEYAAKLWWLSPKPRRTSSTGQYQEQMMQQSPYANRLPAKSEEQSTAPVQWRFWAVKSLGGHSAPVLSATFGPDGKTLVTASGRTVRMWDTAGLPVRSWDIQRREVQSATCAGETIALIEDGRVELGNPGDLQTIWETDGLSLAPHCAALSPDGRQCALGFDDGSIFLWDVAARQQIRTLKAPAPISSLALSADGMLATASRGTINLWDIGRGNIAASSDVHSENVRIFGFSPDGRAVVCAVDSQVLLVNPRDANEVKTFEHRDPVCRADFIGNDSLMSAGGGKVTLWDIATGKAVAEIPCSGHVVSAAVSPDGKIFCTVDENSGARVWDIATAKEIQDLPVHHGRVLCARFAGEHDILTVSADVAILWRIPSARELPEDTPVPAWGKKWTKPEPPPSSSLDFRNDMAAGWFIEKSLDEHPQETAAALFGLDVTNTLATPPLDTGQIKFPLWRD